MSLITLPDNDSWLTFSGLRLSSPAQVNRSEWTGRRKVIGLPGTETWAGTLSVDLITTELEERGWRAFLFSLAGPQNHFHWRLPSNQILGAKPVVAAGATDGYTLPLSGMLPHVRLLRAGQFMTVPLPSGHHRAVCLTADLLADGAGTATAQFRGALNEVPTLGATVEAAKPFIPMSPVEPVLGLEGDASVTSFSMDVEEAL